MSDEGVPQLPENVGGVDRTIRVLIAVSAIVHLAFLGRQCAEIFEAGLHGVARAQAAHQARRHLRLGHHVLTRPGPNPREGLHAPSVSTASGNRVTKIEKSASRVVFSPQRV